MTRPAPTARFLDRRLAEAAVLAVTVVWGVNYVVVKAAIGAFPPITFQFLRYAVATLALVAVLRWREGSVGLPRRDMAAMAVLGSIGYGVYQVLWAIGLLHTTAGNSALIVATSPVLTLLLSAAIRTDRMSRRRIAGVAVSLAGVALVVAATGGLSVGVDATGDLLTLVASACWAVYVSFGAGILRRHSPLRATTWSVAWGTMFLAIPGAWDGMTTAWAHVDALAWFGVVWSGLIAAALGSLVVLHAISLLGPVRITAFQFLSPVVAVATGAIWLGEEVRPGQVAGGLLIAAGIVVIRGVPAARGVRLHVPARRAFRPRRADPRPAGAPEPGPVANVPGTPGHAGGDG